MKEYHGEAESAPSAYARANFKRLFKLVLNACEKRPDLLPPLSQETEKDTEDEKNLLVINSIFDQLASYTSQPKTKRADLAKGKLPYFKVSQYREYVFSLLARRDVSPNRAHHFLSCLFREGDVHLKLAKIICETMIRSPELDDCDSTELVRVMREKIRELAEIMPQPYRPTGVKTEPPFYFHSPRPRFSSRSDLRIYINPSLLKNPKAVIQAMQKALVRQTNHCVLLELNGLGHQDSVTLYCGEEDLNDLDQKPCALEKILTFFVECCNPSLLINGGHPLGFPLSKGVSMTCEPPINFLVDVSQSKKSSSANKLHNNTLTALMMLCAYRLAKGEVDQAHGTLDLKRTTECYYRQFQLISKIHPDSLMSVDINGGRVPEWAKAFNAKYY